MSAPDASVLKTLSIAQILEQYPQTEPVFSQFGLSNYAYTPTASHENLEASALTHSIALPTLIEALLKAIS